jgi:antitoxin HigA-1
MRLPTERSPLHPSEILVEEFMQPYHLTNAMLAEKTGLSLQQINGIINAQKPITPEIALRLSRLFGTSVELWLNGQMQWDIWQIIHSHKITELNAIKQLAIV